MPHKRPAAQLNRAEMSAFMGVEVSTLDAWVRKGCPVVQRGSRGVAWVFDSAAVVKWRQSWMEKAKEASADIHDLNEVRNRKMTAEARKAELDLAEREGSLIPIEDVVDLVKAEYTNVRSRLTALPGELATELEHLTPSEIQEALADAIQDLLGELSADAKYSPAAKPAAKPRKRKAKLPKAAAKA